MEQQQQAISSPYNTTTNDRNRIASPDCTQESPMYYQFYYGAMMSMAMLPLMIPTYVPYIGGTPLIEGESTPDFSVVSPREPSWWAGRLPDSGKSVGLPELNPSVTCA